MFLSVLDKDKQNQYSWDDICHIWPTETQRDFNNWATIANIQIDFNLVAAQSCGIVASLNLWSMLVFSGTYSLYKKNKRNIHNNIFWNV